MPAGDRPGSERSLAAESFRALVYRHFLFDWLFRDASRGSRLEGKAQCGSTVKCATTYLSICADGSRWLSTVAPWALRSRKALSLNYAASGFYFLTCASLVVATMIVRLWLGLKYEYARPRLPRQGKHLGGRHNALSTTTVYADLKHRFPFLLFGESRHSRR